MNASQLAVRLADAWRCTEPDKKCSQVLVLESAAGPDVADIGGQALGAVAGRPKQPRLVRPAELPRRGLGSRQGRAALLHAVAHIEFNAVNLALDAALRFAGMPADYYRDWLSVAADEARHFGMVARRLGELGSEYGAMPAHDGLWSASMRTAHDPLDRMAVVPRVFEARGLDVTPGMIERLHGVGDHASADILGVILREEVRHVQIGSRWFRYLCDQRNLDSEAVFLAACRRHDVLPTGRLNDELRLKAGFSQIELNRLRQAAASGSES